MVAYAQGTAYISAIRLWHYQLCLDIHYGFGKNEAGCLNSVVKYFSRDISGTTAWKMKPVNHLIFWLTKVLYISFYIAIPIVVVGFKAWFIGYLLVNICFGFVLSIVFQLAHIVEKTESEHVPVNSSKQLETAWAEHQLRTTANFAMGNKIINWYVGGLNFQIEHHLFPKISHVHYPVISNIVREKCREFNMPYHYYNTMTDAVISHYKVMKYLGKKPVIA
jgi:linoleoyl-CoA desaturase